MTTAKILDIVLSVLAVAISFLSYYLAIRAKINKAAADAVDNAEEPGKLGKEKLDEAVEQIYALVPPLLKPLFSRAFIASLVQSVFDKMESYAKKQLNKKSNKKEGK